MDGHWRSVVAGLLGNFSVTGTCQEINNMPCGGAIDRLLGK